ncbi:MAG: UvrD-helicase domain-containing protein [Planctomycetota bacterium]
MSVERGPHRLVRASAGSGKTYALTSRYLALLAVGEGPSGVLATTFTRKAAGEVFGRVLERLARAVRGGADRAALEAAVGEVLFEGGWLEGRADSADAASALVQVEWMAVLRRLVGAMDRVSIGTIDGFFSRLLGCFVLELGMGEGGAGGAGDGLGRVIDEGGSEAEALRLRAIEAMLAAEGGGDGGGGDGFETLVRLMREVSHDTARRSVTASLLDLTGEGGLLGIYREASGVGLWDHDLVNDAGALLGERKLEAAVEGLLVAEAELPQTKKGAVDKRSAKAWAKDVRHAQLGAWEAFLEKGIGAALAAGQESYGSAELGEGLLTAYRPLVRHARAVVLGKLERQTRATHALLERFVEHYDRLRESSGVVLFSDLTDRLRAGLAEMDASERERVYYRLDGRLKHLLIDEFQDTSLGQWDVLAPMVDEVAAHGDGSHSFFAVGDTKQAIYGWRGGQAELFDAVVERFGGAGGRGDDVGQAGGVGRVGWGVVEASMDRSWRSSPVVLEAVNRVFGGLTGLPGLGVWERDAGALREFAGRFREHQSAKGLEGQVVLRTMGADEEHERGVAEYVKGLVESGRYRSVGVVVRRNESAAAVLAALRELKVQASGRGGRLLTEEPAVNAVLAALRLAEHPGDSVSAFHVANSPMGELLGMTGWRGGEAERVGSGIRRAWMEEGPGGLLGRWVAGLAGSCGARGLDRLLRLVEMGEGYEPGSRLRLGEFVRMVETTAVEVGQGEQAGVGVGELGGVGGAEVRVMTVHGAKGLEFDAVVLPDLESGMTFKPGVLVEREGGDPLGRVVGVYRAGRKEERALSARLTGLYESAKHRQRVEDLCVLYVAMTRAARGLHVLVRPRKTGGQSLAEVVVGGLAGGAGLSAWERRGEVLYASGELPGADGAHEGAGSRRNTTGFEGQRPPLRPQLGRGAVRFPVVVTPSRAPEGERVSVERLLGGATEGRSADGESADGSGAVYGLVMHAMFERVGFLDESEEPTGGGGWLAVAEAACGRFGLRGVEPVAVAERFVGMLEREPVRALLARREAAGLWRERRFAAMVQGRLVKGVFDRVVLGEDGSAQIVDLKTDRGGSADALVERYRPQMSMYRAALGVMLGVGVERVSVSLLAMGLERGAVVEVGFD